MDYLAALDHSPIASDTVYIRDKRYQWFNLTTGHIVSNNIVRMKTQSIEKGTAP